MASQTCGPQATEVFMLPENPIANEESSELSKPNMVEALSDPELSESQIK